MSQTRPSPRFERENPRRQVLVLDMPGHHGSPFCQRAIPDVAAAIASAGEDAGLDRPVIAGTRSRPSLRPCMQVRTRRVAW